MIAPRRKTISAVLLAALVGCGGHSAVLPAPSVGASPADASAKSIWVSAWAMAADHNSGGYVGSASNEQTFRAIIKPSVGSRGTIRLHFSNVVGTQPLTLGAVHIGVQSTGAGVQAGTDQTVTFAGSGSVTIPPGGTATSDTVPMTFAYGTVLAVTEYMSGSWPWLPMNEQGLVVTSYQTAAGAGNKTADLAGTSFSQPTNDVNVFDRLDVYGPYKETVALIGSSTASGYASDLNQFDSLADDLAKNLHAAGRDDTGVVDMAIIPNALLPANDDYGDLSTLGRFQRDVASLPGIGVVIQEAGDVDLKAGTCSSAATIIPGEQQFISLAHAAGIRVIMPTIAPSTYCGQANTAAPTMPPNTGGDAERQLVNTWIQSTSSLTIEGTVFAPDAADLVVDFSGAVDNPANAGYMLSRDAYDLSHPNAAGQALQAATIPVGSL